MDTMTHTGRYEALTTSMASLDQLFMFPHHQEDSKRGTKCKEMIYLHVNQQDSARVMLKVQCGTCTVLYH